MVIQLETQCWFYTLMQVNQRNHKQQEGKANEIWSSSNISTVGFAMVVSKTILLGEGGNSM